MKRGDVVTVATSGDYGKPRPAVIIQSDKFSESGSVLVCLMTSDRIEAIVRRIPVAATTETGLKIDSQIMVEKIYSIRREKCGAVIGRLDAETGERLNGALLAILGLID